MYPAAKIATSKLTVVTIESMIAAHRIGAEYHVRTSHAADVDPLIARRDRPACCRAPQNPAGTIENNSTYAHTTDTASPNQHGKWLFCAQHLRPKQRRHHRRRQRSDAGSAT